MNCKAHNTVFISLGAVRSREKNKTNMVFDQREMRLVEDSLLQIDSVYSPFFIAFANLSVFLMCQFCVGFDFPLESIFGLCARMYLINEVTLHEIWWLSGLKVAKHPPSTDYYQRRVQSKTIYRLRKTIS